MQPGGVQVRSRAGDGAPLPWHALEATAVEDALDTSPHGLGDAEVAARLARHGPNQLAEQRSVSSAVVIARQFRNPLIYILVVALGITLALGEYLDASVIGLAIALNAIVGFTQERKAERAVQALMGLVVSHARVVRSGEEHEINSAELVPGDIVLLEPGAKTPADLRLTHVNGLQIDESLLTGESLPVTKSTSPVPADTSLADRISMAYTGAIVASGRGIGVVVATGAGTELGAVAGLVHEERTPRTPLQLRMDRFAKIIGVAVLGASIVAFASGALLGESTHDMFLVAVALAVAAVPESLPVAVTVTLAVGVSRMAKRNAIVRRLAAVETLGSTTVIGSDKTGTLTENRMTVQEVWAGGRNYRLAGGVPDGELVDADGEPAAIDDTQALHLTLLTGVLTNEADVHRRDGELVTTGDPTEVAMLMAAMTARIEPSEARSAYATVAEIPFEPAQRYSASVRSHRGRRVVFAKGAPERIGRMCTRMLTEDGEAPFDPSLVEAAARELAGRGLRVLAFAFRRLDEDSSTAGLTGEPTELVFCGLQAMMDPPRAGVRDAIADCHNAGIRVLMITGDHLMTARVIANQLGITAGDGEDPTGAEEGSTALDGTAVRSIDDAELREALKTVTVFARVSPAQKLRIVNALQDMGDVVAVTGDGVNDAPALKAAQIGVAMGRDGTDVASEAADMILADDNFVSITAAVEEGRITFDNIRKVAFFLVSTGVATVSAVLVGVWLGWPLVMVPAQLLWLNIVTSGLQDLALAFEPGEEGVLRRLPRRAREGIMSPMLWERSLIAGAVMAAGTLVLFRWELDTTGSMVRAQTVALTTMVIYQVFQVGNSRSENMSLFRMSPFSNRFLFLATTAAVSIHVAALYFPPTQYVLRVEPIDLEAWVRIVAMAVTILVAMEAHKAWRRALARRSTQRATTF